uniref:Lipoprotein n=1 Tax=Steinernema glaseri TaxID=37863 RepID=A0A1I8ABY6_9BILA
MDLLSGCNADLAPSEGDLGALPDSATVQQAETHAFDEEPRDGVH